MVALFAYVKMTINAKGAEQRVAELILLAKSQTQYSKMTTKRMYGEKTKRRTYTVTDEVHAELQRIGQGNASRGIREAVKQAKD